MKITAINGSPRVKDSNSEKYINIVAELVDKDTKITTYPVAKACIGEEAMDDVMQSEVLLIAFPLYVDGVPANMLKQLIALEKAFKEKSHVDTIVYVIVNNGFYEGEQNRYAIDMIENFCKRAGIRFGQGIGVGAGEMCGTMVCSGMPMNDNVLGNFNDVCRAFAHNIATKQSAGAMYVRPNYPWNDFVTSANEGFWNPKAISNGLSLQDVRRKLEYRR